MMTTNFILISSSTRQPAPQHAALLAAVSYHKEVPVLAAKRDRVSAIISDDESHLHILACACVPHLLPIRTNE